MGVWPRVRQLSQVAKVRNWPTVKDGPRLLGFLGYKSGMTQAILIDDAPHSPYKGRERVRAVTILETPPAIAAAIRTYAKTEWGLKSHSEAWMKDPPKDFERLFTQPKTEQKEETKEKPKSKGKGKERGKTKEAKTTQDSLQQLATNLNEIAEIRVLLASQPRLTSVPKKKPDLFEVTVGGGTVQERFNFAKDLLGKTVEISTIFKEGQQVDALAVSRGRGFQGPVKRFGISILRHKARKTKRGVGAISGRHPGILHTTPRPGQMGLHQRTALNLKLLKIGTKGEEVTPKGGFLRYGVVKGSYTMILGGVPGPSKRLIKLRVGIRAEPTPIPAPRIISIDTSSKQGH
jgi:large subunit ribosomal protein L3